MSLVTKGKTFMIIDHADFINKLYQDVTDNNHKTTYKLTKKLFSIQNFKKEMNRKRNRDFYKLHEETMKVRQMYETFISEIPTELKASINSKYSLLPMYDVRDLSKKLFESTAFDHAGISGGNNSNMPLKCKVKDEYFLIPEKSRFFSGCVKNTCKKLEGSNFNIVIADPPWWNKYIRRLKGANDKLSYSMMYNEDIAAIPVKELVSSNCIVAIWCTNSPSNIDAVKNIIFPRWGVTYVTTWYWLKATVDLQPLCPFGSGSMKQPYERVMMGRVGDIEVPESQLIVSVPSALHSHKPPLLDVLKPYVKENPKILELFARYLLPNTTSVGFEPLKWQHITLYENVSDDL